jgi:hypothetical protein
MARNRERGERGAVFLLLARLEAKKWPQIEWLFNRSAALCLRSAGKC